MEEFYPLSTLTALKARLGPLARIKLEFSDIRSVHRRLGQMVQPQVYKILANRLARISTTQWAHEVSAARQIHAALLEKISSPSIDRRIRAALEEYLACLTAWSQGTQLELAWRDLPGKLHASWDRPTGLDLALFLQKERVGCQTGVYRLEDGSIVLWHTEEDYEPAPGSRFDQLRLISYPLQVGDRFVEVNAFLYPDLLPGPSFSWRSDRYIQAVDTLHLKLSPQNNAILANIATWVTLRLGGEVDLGETIEMLAPFWDGYAITSARANKGGVDAQKVEFAGQAKNSMILDKQAGAFLFQVNVFSENACALAAEYEQIAPQRRTPLQKRLIRTQQALRSMQLDGQPLYKFYELLCSRSGGGYAYANADVKATYIGRLASNNIEAWVGAGPALETDLPNLMRISP